MRSSLLAEGNTVPSPKRITLQGLELLFFSCSFQQLPSYGQNCLAWDLVRSQWQNDFTQKQTLLE